MFSTSMIALGGVVDDADKQGAIYLVIFRRSQSFLAKGDEVLIYVLEKYLLTNLNPSHRGQQTNAV